MEKLMLALKNGGMRKVFYGLSALLAIFALAFAHRISGAEFVACFVPLVGSVMAANYGEHKVKEAAKDEAPKPNP